MRKKFAKISAELYHKREFYFVLLLVLAADVIHHGVNKIPERDLG